MSTAKRFALTRVAAPPRTVGRSPRGAGRAPPGQRAPQRRPPDCPGAVPRAAPL